MTGGSWRPRFLGLDHVQVAAPPGCEPEARHFYGQVLGLKEVAKPPALATRGGVWFRVGPQHLHIGVEEAFTPARKGHPALRVAPADLHNLALRLTEAGTPVTWDEALPGEQRLYTEDPWGNRLELLAAASDPR